MQFRCWLTITSSHQIEAHVHYLLPAGFHQLPALFIGYHDNYSAFQDEII